MSDVRYQHRQSTSVFVALVAVIVVAVGVPAALDGAGLAAVVVGVGALVLAVIVAFSELRTTVTSSRIRVAFRFGWPARTIPLAAVRSHRPVRNRWWWGFGLRLVPGGWMYNVWGLDAVEIRYETDRGRLRTLRVGTDDPDGLDAAIATGPCTGRRRGRPRTG